MSPRFIKNPTFDELTAVQAEYMSRKGLRMNEEIGIKLFKTCPVCKKVWKARNDFMDDPDVVIIGYQVHFKELTEGLFLFNHSCNATLTVRAGAFSDLYAGPMFTTRLTGTDECPGYCLVEHELRPCPAKCDCAYAREIVQLIKTWPKLDWHENR